jgi:5-methyltetrahydrofolate--homocysteine methyltransferase
LLPGTKSLLGQVSWEEMHASYFEQARGLIAGGIDGFMIETSQEYSLQQKIAINACIDASRRSWTQA